MTLAVSSGYIYSIYDDKILFHNWDLLSVFWTLQNQPDDTLCWGQVELEVYPSCIPNTSYQYPILPHTLSYLLLNTGLYRPQNMPNMSTNHTVTISECIYLPSRSIHLQKSVFWRILSEFRIEINHSKDNRIIDKDHHIGTVISALVPDPGTASSWY